MKQNSAEMKERFSGLGCSEQDDRFEFYKLLATIFFPLSVTCTPHLELSYSQAYENDLKNFINLKQGYINRQTCRFVKLTF